MNQLQQLSNHMRQQLATCNRGYIHRVLFGGLHIVLERKFEVWRLAVARVGKSPTITEAVEVGQDFGVPEGADWEWSQSWEWSQRPVRRGGKATGDKYQILECQWVERPAKEIEHADAPRVVS